MRSAVAPLFVFAAAFAPAMASAQPCAGVTCSRHGECIEGAGVLEAHRGRGVFRALLAHRFAEARGAGLKAATIQAYDGHERTDPEAPRLPEGGPADAVRDLSGGRGELRDFAP